MDDLISRAAAIDALTDTELRRNLDSVCDGDMNRTRRAAQRVIAQVPAVDAVPVVMCRDCKYWEMPRTLYGIRYGYCNNMHSHVSSHRMPEENYYCPHGERRESE